MKPHKDLPSGSQPWANEVDATLAQVATQGEVIRRLADNAGLDYSNPQRGVNSSTDAPSIKNPVGQKVSSLADVNSYNVADKQVLTWSQLEQKWIPATPSSGGAAVSIPVEIAGFSGATGYGYLPATSGGPYAVTAQGPDGSAVLAAHDSSGTSSALVTAGVVALSSTDIDYGGESGLSMRGNYWRIGNHVYTGKSSSVESAPDISLTISDPKYVFFDTPYVKFPTCTTAGRPSAPTAGPGAAVYDTTLGIPIYYNGSAWRDALGNAV